MYFRNVIGQQEIKEKLQREKAEGRIAHALLFSGTPGSGTLALALAYARYLLCESPGKEEACGQCPACRRMDKFLNPDLHFVYPVLKRNAQAKTEDTTSAVWDREWRDFIAQSPYTDLNRWIRFMDKKGQAMIYAAESNEIMRKIHIKSGSKNGYKVMIVWYPERMNAVCANKLLKLLEEPPEKTVFLLVSAEPEKLLTTIISRTQRIPVPRISEAELTEALTAQFGLSTEAASATAHIADGDFIKAIETIQASEEAEKHFQLFVELMRLAYTRKVRELKAWSEKLADMQRDQGKHFLIYCQRMVRENFIYNFRHPKMVYLNYNEQQFATRFAPFINENNCIGIMEELDLAQRHIEQNVNMKMIFFDLALRMTVLIKQR